MARPKLTYTFHNPNSEEQTILRLSEILAEVAVAKVRQAQEEYIKLETDSGKEIAI